MTEARPTWLDRPETGPTEGRAPETVRDRSLPPVVDIGSPYAASWDTPAVALPDTIEIRGRTYGLAAIPGGFVVDKEWGVSHTITQGEERPSCDCKDFVYRHAGLPTLGCRHIQALRAAGLIPQPTYQETPDMDMLAAHGMAPISGASPDEDEPRGKMGRQLLSWHCRSCGKLGSLSFPIDGEEHHAVEAQRADHRERSPGCLAVLTYSHFGTGGQSTFEEQRRDTLDSFFNNETAGPPTTPRWTMPSTTPSNGPWKTATSPSPSDTDPEKP